MGHECASLSIRKQTGEHRVVDRRKSTGSQACTHSHVLTRFQNFKSYIAGYLDTDRLQMVLVGFFIISENLASIMFLNLRKPVLLGCLSLKQIKLQGFVTACGVLCSGFFSERLDVCMWRCFFPSLMGC